MSRIDNIGQNGNTGEHYGEPLTWPISEELVGRKVRFDGYRKQGQSHWGYKEGEIYTIDKDDSGDVGPSIGDASPSENYGFKFTLLPEQEIPDGYYHDDEEDKLKPLKRAVPSPDMVNHPPHYQTDGIECIDAIRASLGLDGFVAYCRGNAIKYSWRAGKKDETAQDLKKAAWYLNRAADELIKNNERTAGVNE